MTLTSFLYWPPQSSYNEHTDRVAMVTEGEATMGPITWTSTYPGQSSCCPCISNFPATVTNTEALIWHYFLRRPNLLANWFHVLLPSQKGQQVVLAGMDTYSKYGFAFPTHRASASTMPQVPWNAWSKDMEFHTTQHSTKRLVSQLRRYWSGLIS